MNKRIFSLVCIALYALLDASIYCSEQKNDRSNESGLRSRIIRAFKKTKRSNKKNDIESQRENQLNNNNNNDDDESHFKYINSEQYKEKKYKYVYCCGLCYQYIDPDDSFNSHTVNMG
ncbi:fam-c protein [Plasmodium vinckei brucechwatti]|uniref:Fam-c protein n=1 Tax=Plasmodium vinckei brucechwatti TaxID=119398 RepID=A0A6V7RUT3_PLAVN|nr:fam-c protein [Plasmodium vinckei brucechwatti]